MEAAHGLIEPVQIQHRRVRVVLPHDQRQRRWQHIRRPHPQCSHRHRTGRPVVARGIDRPGASVRLAHRSQRQIDVPVHRPRTTTPTEEEHTRRRPESGRPLTHRTIQGDRIIHARAELHNRITIHLNRPVDRTATSRSRHLRPIRRRPQNLAVEHQRRRRRHVETRKIQRRRRTSRTRRRSRKRHRPAVDRRTARQPHRRQSAASRIHIDVPAEPARRRRRRTQHKRRRSSTTTAQRQIASPGHVPRKAHRLTRRIRHRDARTASPDRNVPGRQQIRRSSEVQSATATQRNPIARSTAPKARRRRQRHRATTDRRRTVMHVRTHQRQDRRTRLRNPHRSTQLIASTRRQGVIRRRRTKLHRQRARRPRNRYRRIRRPIREDHRVRIVEQLSPIRRHRVHPIARPPHVPHAALSSRPRQRLPRRNVQGHRTPRIRHHRRIPEIRRASHVQAARSNPPAITEHRPRPQPGRNRRQRNRVGIIQSHRPGIQPSRRVRIDIQGPAIQIQHRCAELASQRRTRSDRHRRRRRTSRKLQPSSHHFHRTGNPSPTRRQHRRPGARLRNLRPASRTDHRCHPLHPSRAERHRTATTKGQRPGPSNPLRQNERIVRSIRVQRRPSPSHCQIHINRNRQRQTSSRTSPRIVHPQGPAIERHRRRRVPPQNPPRAPHIQRPAIQIITVNPIRHVRTSSRVATVVQHNPVRRHRPGILIENPGPIHSEIHPATHNRRRIRRVDVVVTRRPNVIRHSPRRRRRWRQERRIPRHRQRPSIHVVHRRLRPEVPNPELIRHHHRRPSRLVHHPTAVRRLTRREVPRADRRTSIQIERRRIRHRHSQLSRRVRPREVRHRIRPRLTHPDEPARQRRPTTQRDRIPVVAEPGPKAVKIHKRPRHIGTATDNVLSRQQRVPIAPVKPDDPVRTVPVHKHIPTPQRPCGPAIPNVQSHRRHPRRLRVPPANSRRSIRIGPREYQRVAVIVVRNVRLKITPRNRSTHRPRPAVRSNPRRRPVDHHRPSPRRPLNPQRPDPRTRILIANPRNADRIVVRLRRRIKLRPILHLDRRRPQRRRPRLLQPVRPTQRCFQPDRPRKRRARTG